MIRTVRCRQCGYNLAGLRPAGTCPECGAQFDKGRQIGTIEDTPQRRLDRRLRRLRTLVLLGAGLVVGLAASIVALLTKAPGQVLSCGGFGAGLLLLGAAASYAYEGEE